MQQEEKYIYMTKTPVPRLIGELAVPTIISMLVTSFYNMADTFFVGKINTQSTAAVGVVFSVMALIQALGFFFGHGSGNYISRRLGAKDFEEAAAMAANGFFLAFLCGITVMVGGMIFLKPLAVALGSTPTILPYTESYLKIILIGAPFMTSSLVLNNQLRFQGSAAYAMVGIVTGAVINIALDPLLIFVCGMGVAGAAAATVISQFCSFLLLMYQSRKGGNIKISFSNFKPNGHYKRNLQGRRSVLMPSGACEHISDFPESRGRGLRRCGDCRNVHCIQGLHVCKFCIDWFRPGVPAGMRI